MSQKPEAIYRTPRLILRRFKESDIPDMHLMFSSEAVKWSMRGLTTTLEESEEHLKTNFLPGPCVFAIELPGEPSTSCEPDGSKRSRAIGSVGSRFPGMFGYMFHKDFWGRGYATEAVKAFLSIYWRLKPEETNLKGFVDPENPASVKVLLKCGFKEGPLEETAVFLPAVGLRPVARAFDIDRTSEFPGALLEEGPVYRTARLLLRRIEPLDLHDLHLIWSSEAAKWSLQGPFTTLEQSEEELQKLIASEAVIYAVEILGATPIASNSEDRLKMPRVIGIVRGVTRDEWGLGYIFNPEFWGHGYATEAIRAFLNLYWNARPSESRLNAWVDPENKASIKMLEKCGFKELGRVKGEYLPALGQRDSEIVYQIDRDIEITSVPDEKQSIFESKRLRLRPVYPFDLDDFHLVWTDPKATKWTSRPMSKSLDDSQNLLAPLLKPNAQMYSIELLPEESETFALASKATPKLRTGMIGTIGCYNDDHEVGYILNSTFWGHGYATEALALWLDIYWAARPDAPFVEAAVDAENPVSIRVLEKCGFTERERRPGIVLPNMGPEKRETTIVFRVNRDRGDGARGELQELKDSISKHDL